MRSCCRRSAITAWAPRGPRSRSRGDRQAAVGGQRARPGLEAAQQRGRPAEPEVGARRP